MDAELLIQCACGCGDLLDPRGRRGRPRRFLPYHWSRLQASQKQAVPCEWCGIPLMRQQWHLKKVAHYFCGLTCAGQWARANGIRRGSNNGHYNTVTVGCAGCGAPVSKAVSLIKRRSQRVYCPTCIPKIVHRGRKGFYVGYPPAFSAKLRAEIRKRDNYSCRLCDKPQKQAGTLHVHHIDYNTQHNNPQNLISLCRVCHGLTNFALAEWTTRLQAMMQT